MSTAELVKGCPLFHEIYDDEIEDIISNCLVASFEPGDFIIEQGGEGTDIYVILSGEADISVSKDGDQQYIATIGRGDLFGELVLINETKRTANIVARESCNILVMTYDDFFNYFHKNSKVFSLMVLNVTRLLTKRLKSSNSSLEKLGAENTLLKEELNNYKKSA